MAETHVYMGPRAQMYTTSLSEEEYMTPGGSIHDGEWHSRKYTQLDEWHTQRGVYTKPDTHGITQLRAACFDRGEGVDAQNQGSVLQGHFLIARPQHSRHSMSYDPSKSASNTR